MRKILKIVFILLPFLSVFSCKNDDLINDDLINNPPTGDNYSSIENFYSVNAVPMQTYYIDGTAGGSFTTPNGTKVTIPENAFMSQSTTTIQGNVTIYFKDIYKKSDMLFNQLSTNMQSYFQRQIGEPIKSAGMFYIKAVQNSQTLQISSGKKITINQPFNGLPVDTAMIPLILIKEDSIKGWTWPQRDSIGKSNDSLS